MAGVRGAINFLPTEPNLPGHAFMATVWCPTPGRTQWAPRSETQLQKYQQDPTRSPLWSLHSRLTLISTENWDREIANGVSFQRPLKSLNKSLQSSRLRSPLHEQGSSVDSVSGGGFVGLNFGFGLSSRLHPP